MIDIQISSSLAMLLACASLILVTFWATSDDTGFLGKPNLSSNIFAWHPLLMIGGFFFCHILAIGLVQSTKSIVIHSMIHALGIGSLVLGLITVFKSIQIGKAHLTSLHSWYGISAACLYTVNFCLGITKHSMRLFARSDNPAFMAMVVVHPYIGLTSLWATTIAISTGLVSFLGVDFCSYEISQNPLDPIIGYSKYSEVCKLVNGLGIVTLSGTILLTYSICRSISAGSTEPAESTYYAGSNSAPAINLRMGIEDPKKMIRTGWQHEQVSPPRSPGHKEFVSGAASPRPRYY